MSSPSIPYFGSTDLDSPILEFALALAAFKDTDWHPSGTAVVVAPHIALTAKHVVEGFWQRFDPVRQRLGDPAGTFCLVAFQVQPRKQGALWKVTRLWLSPHSDFAVLELLPYSRQARSYRWRCAQIELVPPDVGSRVSAFGYAGGSVNVEVNGEIAIGDWTSNPATTVADVTKVFHSQRDSGMLSFPSFAINGEFRGGMSGGPVFNAEGRLCGLICSSMEASEEGGSSVSYAASIWPILLTKVGVGLSGRPPDSTFPIIELVNQNIVRANGLDRFVVNRLADDEYRIQWRFSP